MPELVSTDADDFVDAALRRAGDLGLLAEDAVRDGARQNLDLLFGHLRVVSDALEAREAASE